MSTTLKILTEEQRIEAKNTAKQNVKNKLGNEPEREKFNKHKPVEPKIEDYLKNITSKYPEWFNRTTMTLLMVVFVGLAYPSLVRLFLAGYQTFQHDSITGNGLAMLAGFSTFITAEFMLIVSTIAFRTVAKSRVMKILLVIAMVMALAMALVGNHTIVQPTTVFEWLETVVPPLGTLIMGFVLESVMLHSIEQRAEATEKFNNDYERYSGEYHKLVQQENQEYQEALNRWREIFYSPEKYDGWMLTYATALRDKIFEINSKGSGKTARIAYMQTLTSDDWKALVTNEMKRENWMSYTGENNEANFIQA